MRIQEKTIVAKLIKAYIISHQGCTAKEIWGWLCVHDFGLQSEYGLSKISRLIRDYRVLRETKDGFNWFNVNIDKTSNPSKYYVGDG